MNNAARAWLAERADGVPQSLANVMNTALATVPADASVALALCDAAMNSLETALRAGDDRSAALHLLAADALLTAACEAALDNPEAASLVAERFATDRLAAMFAAQLSAERP